MGSQVLIFKLVLAATLFGICALAALALTPDGKTLLEIKNVLNDTNNALASWRDTDNTPCLWTGISCNSKDQTVISINLPYMQLGGIISPSIGKLSGLQRLALHQNSLHGLIPHEIANCTDLKAL
ncbi:LRR receptor-like serine/threonine-protein kinase FEI 1 [Bienertia sinuspersici]